MSNKYFRSIKHVIIQKLRGNKWQYLKSYYKTWINLVQNVMYI